MQVGNKVDPAKRLVYVAVSDNEAKAESFNEAKQFFAIAGRIHLLLGLYHEGQQTVMQDFENALYPYGTEQNKNYEFRAFWWQRIAWTIASIPTHDEERARNFFMRRRRTLEAATFHAYTDNGNFPFPFRGDQFRLIC